MKKFIIKNKFPIILSVLFILLVLIGYNVYKILMPDSNSAVYGSRLDNKKAITKETYDKLVANLSADTNVVSVKTDERGLLINVLITVKKDTTINNSKNLSKITVETFSEEELAMYDVQLIISNESKEMNNYPIIGYKNKKKENFSWTKDRVVE